MIEIIKEIFKEAGFTGIENKSFTVFSYDDKTSFWIVIETNSLDFLHQQDELFIEAKEGVQNVPSFDKNASLLLLHKIPDDADFTEYKKQIIEIEEDPYHFKKQVLLYNETAKDELETQLLLDGFKETLSNQDTFKKYKEEYSELSWQALLYRTAQKLPFIEIIVEKNKNLASLFQSNQSAIKSKNLEDFHNHFTDAFNNKSADDIKGMSPDAVLDLLLTEDEKSYGTENK